MVDPSGFRPISIADRRVAPVAAAAPVKAADGATQAARSGTAASITRAAAASAPVDVERVARIKKAIADGNFPLVPSTVADRLLALKLQWNPNDKA